MSVLDRATGENDDGRVAEELVKIVVGDDVDAEEISMREGDWLIISPTVLIWGIVSIFPACRWREPGP